MSFFTSLFGKGAHRKQADLLDLGAVWNSYSDQWPQNNERFDGWKPSSILPASKADVRAAVRIAYQEWTGVLDWTIFSAFFMEYVDLALHVPPDDYEAIKAFRGEHASSPRTGKFRDPFSRFKLSSTLAVSMPDDVLNHSILDIRNHFASEMRFNYPDSNNAEVGKLKAILLRSATEFCSEVAAWRYFILSVGKDTYVESNSP